MNLVLGDVEEVITVVDIMEGSDEEVVRVSGFGGHLVSVGFRFLQRDPNLIVA